MIFKPARRSLPWLFCVALLSASPAARSQADADATTTTRPSGTRPSRPADPRPHRPRGDQASQGLTQGGPALFDRARPGPGADALVMPTDEQWAEAAAFLAEASPSRWEVYAKLLDHPVKGERAKRFIYARYAELRALRDVNVYRYNAAREQVRLEDDVYRLDSEIKAASSPGEAEQLAAQLRESVTSLVQQNLDERRRRLSRLQEKLDREQEELRVDLEKRDEVVERRIEVLRRASDRFRAWATTEPRRDGNRGGAPDTSFSSPEGAR